MSWFCFSLLQVKRACGQASWADKDEQDGESPAGGHQVSGEQEILGGTITEGRISTGESQCSGGGCKMTRIKLHGCDCDGRHQSSRFTAATENAFLIKVHSP
jgi:hypothetical protein